MPWVEDCPLRYTSPNALKDKCLGIFCAVHFGGVYPLRPYYANTRGLRQRPLLGMTKVVERQWRVMG